MVSNPLSPDSVIGPRLTYERDGRVSVGEGSYGRVRSKMGAKESTIMYCRKNKIFILYRLYLFMMSQFLFVFFLF